MVDRVKKGRDLMIHNSPAGGLLLCTLLMCIVGASMARGSDHGGPLTAADRAAFPELTAEDARDGPLTFEDRVFFPLSADELEVGLMALVAEYPGHWLRRRPKRARVLAADVYAVQEEYNVPGEVLVAVMRRESSLGGDTRVGPGGEIGIMQIHPWVARRFNCDLSTQRGQIECGAMRLREAFDRCGTWHDSLVVYVTRAGKCKSKSRRILWIAQDRLGIATRVREVALNGNEEG